MRKLNIPKKSELQFALCGSGKTLCDFARLVKKRGYNKPIIVTHPKEEHERDKNLFDNEVCRDMYESVFACSKELSIPVHETSDINSSDTIDWLENKGANVAISFGLRSIAKKQFFEVFSGKVMNCHSTDLPRNRGAATYTWLTLNSEEKIYGTIHMMDEEIDNGDIIIKREKPISSERPFPIDYMRETHKVTIKALREFLDLVEEGDSVKLKEQKKEEGTYFPRLLTEINGAIDWRWDARTIARFVRAFSWPYPGAFTFYGDDKVHISDAKVINTSEDLHPFARGIIFREYQDGGVGVAATQGSAVKVLSLRRKGSEVSAAEHLRVGRRLTTPSDVVDKSLVHRASF